MLRVRRALIPLVALLAALVPASPSAAAEPAAGTVSSASPQVSWSGGPLPFTTLGTGCDPAGPTCDVFALTIGSLAADANDVVISVAAGNPSDVAALYVYGPDGTQVASDSALTANPRVTLRDVAAGAYSVRVEAMLSTSGLLTYKAVATATEAGAPPDAEVPCTGDDAGLGPPPQAVLDAALNDDGRVVFLDVLVLLDGVDEAFARKFFERVSIPYAELNITVVPTFGTVAEGAITSDVTTEIIAQTKELVPGRRVPEEFDVVELLTKRDIEALGQKAIAGQAECIGGVAFKEHSFNVSEAQQDADQGGVAIGPLRLIPDQAAKITAHEIGHLLGGQHHFANCVEGGRAEDITSGADSSPCTLMFNSADFISLQFGTLNGRIVRGYALVHASANDAARNAAAAGTAPPAAGSAGGPAAPSTPPAGTLPATGGEATLLPAAVLALLLLARGRRRWREPAAGG